MSSEPGDAISDWIYVHFGGVCYLTLFPFIRLLSWACLSVSRAFHLGLAFFTPHPRAAGTLLWVPRLCTFLKKCDASALRFWIETGKAGAKYKALIPFCRAKRESERSPKLIQSSRLNLPGDWHLPENWEARSLPRWVSVRLLLCLSVPVESRAEWGPKGIGATCLV